MKRSPSARDPSRRCDLAFPKQGQKSRDLGDQWPYLGVAATGYPKQRVGFCAGRECQLIEKHEELAERLPAEQRLCERLEALHQTSLTIASAHSSQEILQRLVEQAAALIGTRYAALGVLGPHGDISEFYTAGVSEAERRHVGPPPKAHGLLGVLLTGKGSVRTDDITTDPRATGFPAGHPAIRSLLGVPIALGLQVVGNLYLSQKRDGGPFSAEDERLLVMMASHAAVVIENARLGEQVRSLAIAAERERIRKDLHDGVIQILYAVNLDLEGALDTVEQDHTAAARLIDGAIVRISAVIEEVREAILGLKHQADALPEVGE